MAWDLRGALLKKEEMESARLVDFEFRLRARSMRLLAERNGWDAKDLVERTATHPDQRILADLAAGHGLDPAALGVEWAACVRDSRVTLIKEIGDPTPHRLA